MNGGWWSYIRYDEGQGRPSIDRAVLSRVATYARPYAWKIALMLCTIFAITGLSLLPPLLIRALVDDALPNRDFGLLNLLAAGMVCVPILSGLVGVGQRYLAALVGEGIICDLRGAVFAQLQRQSLHFFTTSKTGELMARVNNDVVGAQQAISSTMVSVISNAVALVGTLAVMLTLEWRLTLAAILILPLFILPARRMGQVLRRITREGMTLNAQMNGMMNETLNVSGALLVKLFGRERDESRRFADRARSVRDVGIRQALIGRWFFLGLSMTGAVGTAIVFWAGGYLVLTEGLTVGTVVAFSAYLAQLYGPLSSLANARVELATSLVSFERVFEVLDLPVEIEERPGALRLVDVRGKIRFDHVWFDYDASDSTLAEVERWGSREPVARPRLAANGLAPSANGAAPPAIAANGAATLTAPLPPTADAAPPIPARRWALEDVDLTIEPGQLVALVGPSGAGKTTLTYLLPRLYDPTEGRVLVDDHDLRDVALDSLVREIGVVTQESHLFHDSIRANLLYARDDATDSQMVAACTAAYIHDFIAGLPDGYDTVVGERGYRLSGGEKQRIAIARILLKDPRILILDEATAHLDSESEVQIQAALERAMLGRTSLVIAHRLSTILAADVILVVEAGRLVERGTHAELLAKGGLYTRLYRTQFRAAAPATAGA